MGNFKKMHESSVKTQKDTYNPVRVQSTQETKKQKEKDNIHRLHQQLIDTPLPRGLCQEWIGGHVLDLGMLSEFITYKTSPTFITNVINNVTAKVREDTLDMRKKKPLKISGGIIILIIIAIACILIGLFVMMYLPDIIKLISGGK
jgi:hypothetical protein